MTATADQPAASRFDAQLPAMIPFDEPARVLLFTMRRMATDGIDDAHAAHALLIRFGLAHRRPLVLLRALMLELSRAAHQPIRIAPCCCPRMTAAEALLVEVARTATGDPHGAHALLADVLGTPDCLGALTTAQAVAAAFEDGGLPLS